MNDALPQFLKEARRHIPPKKEATLFSLGGRGYYENATSDLLAFFMRPDAHHGLKELFLSTYLECMGESPDAVKLENIKVEREVSTKNQKRIDIQILRVNKDEDDWCLLIENKIRHWEANPFSEYEEHAANTLGGNKKMFSILSPSGIDEKRDNWVRVSYGDYCSRMERKMKEGFPCPPSNKWQWFAQEFILHLKEEIYDHSLPMTNDQLAFVEKHFAEINDVRNLAECYEKFILAELERRLEESIHGAIFIAKVDRWHGFTFVFRCRSEQWGGSSAVLFTDSGSTKFKIRFYLEHSDSSATIEEKLKHMDGPERENGSLHYWTSQEYDSADLAISGLCEMVSKLDPVLRVLIQQ